MHLRNQLFFLLQKLKCWDLEILKSTYATNYYLITKVKMLGSKTNEL